MVSSNTRIFLRGLKLIKYAEKAELSKCSWYPKRKLGVSMYLKSERRFDDSMSSLSSSKYKVKLIIYIVNKSVKIFKE